MQMKQDPDLGAMLNCTAAVVPDHVHNRLVVLNIVLDIGRLHVRVLVELAVSVVRGADHSDHFDHSVAGKAMLLAEQVHELLVGPECLGWDEE